MDISPTASDYILASYRSKLHPSWIYLPTASDYVRFPSRNKLCMRVANNYLMANYNQKGPFVKTEDCALQPERAIRENRTCVSDLRSQHDLIRASGHMTVRTVEKASPDRVI